MRKIAKKQYVGIICAFLVAIIACVFTLKFFPQSAKAENVSGEKISNLTEGEHKKPRRLRRGFFIAAIVLACG